MRISFTGIYAIIFKKTSLYTYQHLPRGSVWIPGMVYGHPEHHPFSTLWNIQVWIMEYDSMFDSKAEIPKSLREGDDPETWVKHQGFSKGKPQQEMAELLPG